MIPVVKRISSIWLSPDGDVFESSYKQHVQKVCEIFNIDYKPGNSLLYYRIAFFHNYIKISKTKEELSIQLTKPATRKQKSILLDMYRTFNGDVYVEYNTYNSQIFSEQHLLHFINGSIN
ncbi:MAG: hypothetical protein ACOC56_02155 [Atribacterota bacterium]